MQKRKNHFKQSSQNEYIRNINNSFIEEINKLYATPELLNLNNAVQQLGGIASSPAFENLNIAAQQLGGIANSPAFENVNIASQQLGGIASSPVLKDLSKTTQQIGNINEGFYNSTAIQSISKIAKEINDSIYKASAVSTLGKIVDINQSKIKSVIDVAATPAYQKMALAFQESIAVNKIYNEIISNIVNETQVNITNFIDRVQLSGLSLEELIENPYEEINSEDIHETLKEESIYEIFIHLGNKIDENATLLENKMDIESAKNENTRKQVNKLEKDSDKLYTKQDIIRFLITLLVLPIFNPFIDMYEEWISQPSTHIVKSIKKEITNSYKERESYYNFRIVKKDNLKIKKITRVDSETLGTLGLGNLVEVIDKKRNWTKVRISDYKNEVVEGWVFTRYLEKIIE